MVNRNLYLCTLFFIFMISCSNEKTTKGESSKVVLPDEGIYEFRIGDTSYVHLIHNRKVLNTLKKFHGEYRFENSLKMVIISKSFGELPLNNLFKYKFISFPKENCERGVFMIQTVLDENKFNDEIVQSRMGINDLDSLVTQISIKNSTICRFKFAYLDTINKKTEYIDSPMFPILKQGYSQNELDSLNSIIIKLDKSSDILLIKDQSVNH